MRLLTVSHFYDGHGGGIERVAAQLCREFAQSGHHAIWAASDADPPPRSAVEAIPLRCWNPMETAIGLPMPIPGPRSIRDLARTIRTSDAIIVHDALYLTSIFATLLGKLQRKRVVMIQHIAGIEFANPFMRGIMRIANQLVTRPMLRAADELIFISDHVRRELLSDSPSREFTLLFNGVDTTIFHPGDAMDRRAIRLAHGLPVNATTAIFVGRFVAKKGLAVLRALARRRPDWHFALVGAGPILPATWELPNVHVLGPLPQQTIAQLYSACDLLLLPSVGEGYPLVIQEAMACGLPVVCGDGSACADPAAERWLHSVKINLSDPETSAIRCATAIDKMDNDSIDRTGMARYAAITYSWQVMARAIIESLLRPADALHCATGSSQPG